MKYILTVDTEEDRGNNINLNSIKNIARLNYFQKLCDKYGIKPTYLCTYNVVKSDVFRSFVDRFTNFEIGAHLHPWVNPPFFEIDKHGKKTYPTEYGKEEFKFKMEELTKAVSQISEKPLSYRAGRFGFDPKKHAKILLDLGYRIDSSVTPGINWNNTIGFKQGGPDYSDFENKYFYISSTGIFSDQLFENSLLEIPVTIIKTGDRNLWFRIYPKKYGIGKITLATLINISNLYKIISYCRNIDDCLIVMFLHSNELHEECNPYFKTARVVKKLFKGFETLFNYIKKNNIESIGMKDFFFLKANKKI